jgi:sugar transferase (PEP-CTERM/EpsH1 system associated)
MRSPLLFISHRIPYPPTKGEKIRSFNFLKYLSKNHDVHLACLIDDPMDMEAKDQLGSYVREMYVDVVQPKVKTLRSGVALFAGKAITNHYFYSAKIQKEIDRITSRITFKNVFCSSSPTAEYLYKSKNYRAVRSNASVIMDLIDVDSYKWRQYSGAATWPMNWVYKKESEHLLSHENRIAASFDHIILTSENEKRLFLSQSPDSAPVTVIQNGVDLDYFSPKEFSNNLSPRPNLVFTGVMDYYPNSEGVCWFARSVLPLIRKKIPEAHFYIVGSSPSNEVKALGRKGGITVTGFVDDVRDYIASADVCVVPLRIARGIQNKVLEAMAMGKPVVSTPQALGGIQAKQDEEIVVADSAERFAHQILALISDPQRAKKMGNAARRCVERHYSWDNNLKAIEPLLA